MFETLFSRPAAIQRHYTGPYANEWAAYLEQLAAQGTPRTTMRNPGALLLGDGQGACKLATGLSVHPS